MKAQDIMTQPVITAPPETPVAAVAALLASHGFSAVPVVDRSHQVVGIVTEADIIRGRITPDGERRPVWDEPGSTVAAVMTAGVLTMPPVADVADVVAVMLRHNIRSMPIVEDGSLVGIISRRDVLRVVANRELTTEDVWRRRIGLVSHARGDTGHDRTSG